MFEEWSELTRFVWIYSSEEQTRRLRWQTRSSTWRVTSENFEERALKRVVLLLMKRRAQCQHCQVEMSLSSIYEQRTGREISLDQRSECFFFRSCSRSVRWRKPNFEAFMLSFDCCSLELQLPLHSILTLFCFTFTSCFVLRIIIFNTLSIMSFNQTLFWISHESYDRWTPIQSFSESVSLPSTIERSCSHVMTEI